MKMLKKKIEFKIKRFFPKKKASALFYAVIISTVVAILCFAMILNSLFYKKIHQTYWDKIEHFQSLDSGTNILLAETKSDVKEYKVKLNEKFTLSLSKKVWGLYEMACVKSIFRKKDSLQQNHLMGYHYNPAIDPSLYLSDQNKPVSLAGEIHLLGKLQLPKAGYKKAYVDRIPFSGTDIEEENISKSSKKLPSINRAVFNLNKERLNGQVFPSDSLIALPQQIDWGFGKKTLLIKGQKMNLANIALKGNIVIMAEEIQIEASANIQDIILYAKTIVIEEGFEGNLQAFASENIQVKKEVDLIYPSSLMLIPKKNNEVPTQLEIEDGAHVAGSIVLYNENKKTNQSILITRPECKIYGLIYSNALSQIQGEIIGSVFSKGFKLKTPASLYDNYLFNVSIDNGALPAQFAEGIVRERKNPKRTIVKWLN